MPVEQVYCSSELPEVSVIIPTWDGQRGGNVPRLVEQFKRQTLQGVEVILSLRESPNGRSRNLGAERAQGKFLVFVDDDAILGDDSVLERLVEPLRKYGDVGMTGVSQQIPLDANEFQHRCAGQIPRAVSPVVEELTDSDMVTTLCLAIRRELFEQIGGMNDRIRAGVDPDLRHRVREAGYRVVVVPHAWAYHPAPDSMKELVRYGFKKGSLTAWQYRFARDLMYDCPEGHVGDFTTQTSLPYRIMRRGVQLFGSVVRLRLLGIVYDLSYTSGYLWGLVQR
jgi:glycosyltransferase involved in cell wall biosynthesis